MTPKVYICSCSRNLSINGRKPHDRLCKGHSLEPSSLVGCFREHLQEDDLLVSPTLFMNLHHGKIDESLIERLIKAEWERLSGFSVRKSTYSVSSQVAVISDRETLLREFLETYAGVLDLKPVLLKRASSKEFLSGELLSVEGQFNHYIITLQSPQPVDTSLCTHCGLCIGVCSEGCINNDLAVDLTKCSFCGKCQQVCPEGAIDLHRYSEERIETAQLVVDDALQVKLPEDRRGIFSFNDLKGLFRNIGDYQVEELLFHSPSICQYHRGFDLGCKRCLQVCPSGAIKKGKESLEIDSFICTGCGRCVSVCPTGAVQYVPFNDEAFIRYLTSLSPRGYTLVIAKEEELRGLHFARLNETLSETLFIEHPCPEALGRFHFLALFAYGVRGVYTELNPEASFVNALLKELYGVEDFIRPFSIDAQFRAVENPLKEPLRIGFSQRHVSLAELMNALVPEGRDIRISDPSDLFSDINCDTEGCTLCLACVNVCSAGAMRAEEKDFSLRAYPPHCINCSLCVEVCPEGVLSLKSLERLNREFFQERLLAQDEPLRCKRCGKVFGNRKVYDEVVRRLTEAGLFAEKGRFLHLCEDCRVIALFEGSLTEG